MQYRDFQARLGVIHDPMRRKLLDNTIGLIGTPTDCIRITVKKNDEGDKLSSKVEKADIVNIVFPPMIDVPYRYIKKTNAVGDRDAYQITSLVAATTDEEQKSYEVSAPHGVSLDVGDLICRVFMDNEQTIPIVLVLEITEMLGTFGSSAIISHKYKSVIPIDKLPEAVSGVIAEMAQRRLNIRF